MKYRFVRYRYWFRFVSRSWLDTDISSKNFVCLKDVLKMSSRHVSRCLHSVYRVRIFRFPRHLQNVMSSRLEDVLKTFLKTKNCYNEDVYKTSSRNVFKTSSRHVFKTSSRQVFKTSSRHVLKTTSRRLENQQMFAG